MTSCKLCKIKLFFAIFTIFFLWFFASTAYSEGKKQIAGESGLTSKQPYPDQAGKDAIRLWTEKERDRKVSEAIRRYWDYWNSRQPSQYSAYRLWYELEQTQRWLNDPDHNPPPPPPPVPPGHFVPYPYPPYPYMYYPPPWSYRPWYLPSYDYPSPYHRKKK